MFRHTGKTRTLAHNLKIASLLSFVAGIVNVTGFLAVQRLTTNVTGHFAFLVDEVFRLHFLQALVFFSYIFFFLLGSFVAGFMVEYVQRVNERYEFIIPVIAESVILFAVAVYGPAYITSFPDVIACSLLFAMGIQNSLVTRISNAVVRTTHLTGLFTDLGIELSQLFFYKEPQQKQQLLSSVRLRLTIISFFFTGGIVGGVCYSQFGMHVLLLCVVCLLAGIIYDYFKFKVITITRKLKK